MTKKRQLFDFIHRLYIWYVEHSAYPLRRRRSFFYDAIIESLTNVDNIVDFNAFLMIHF
ncbi:hypothetical protein BMS3Bbin06_00034 [bacterium BMS3Bbin06]|nr:hypothetical protein BMS3Bbin06_00034 [bacterium BMS3Bbin06]